MEESLSLRVQVTTAPKWKKLTSDGYFPRFTKYKTYKELFEIKTDSTSQSIRYVI